tara:strand:- start:208 stop:942 length:735 start_codon:yes stop_codon:yes gene_type:complete
MKVAVIITGRIDFVSEENFKLNKKLLEGCDIFIHSDIDYKLNSAKLNPVSVILTENDKFNCLVDTYYKVYKPELLDLEQKYTDKIHWDGNFERIIQWVRLEESLSSFNLEKYDVVLKWRTDLPKVSGRVRTFLEEFTSKYVNFQDFFNSKYNPKYFYMYSDLVFGGSLENMHKCSFYKRIKDFIGINEKNYSNISKLLDQCDRSAGRFEWLDPKNRDFINLFCSETAIILNNLENELVMKSFVK